MFTLSVGALNEQIKSLLETSFTHVFVEGELSRITFHTSGHIYFTLKDADSTISAVIFKANAAKLKFRLEEGMKVVVSAALSLYKPRGSYQLNCFSIEPSGQGALALAYDQLKKKLAAKGYFAEERKKPLPRFVKKIALITSATGAALQDMLRVANARYRAISIDVYDVLVQGQSAAFEIANALKVADTKGYDIIVLSRGGGSVEDLWAFNEEHLADAIFYAQTPVVSAVGHEIDWLISDFVADLRAPTPSAAMLMILPDSYELLQTLDSYGAQFTQLMRQKIASQTQALEHLKNSYMQHSAEKKIAQQLQSITQLKELLHQRVAFNLERFERAKAQLLSSYPQQMEGVIKGAQTQLSHLRQALEANHPRLKSKRGFAQISQNERVIDLASLSKGDLFEAQSEDVIIRAEVLEYIKLQNS